MALSKVSTNQIDTAATPTVAEATVTGDLTVDTSTLHVDSTNNRVGIGTASPATVLHVSGGVMLDGITVIGREQTTYDSAGAEVLIDASASTPPLICHVGGTERFRIDSDGNVGIGTSSPSTFSPNTTYANVQSTVKTDQALTIGSYYQAGVEAYSFIKSSEVGSPTTGNDLRFFGGTTERMRIDSSGRLLVGTTDTALYNNTSGNGFIYDAASGATQMLRDGATVVFINRASSDGALVTFSQGGTSEGNISVSGTTVSYNGGHLARWSQLADNTKDTSIVKGTVMTNLDQMAVWHHEAQPATYYEEGDELPEGVSIGDEKTAAVAAYDEDNEQLNCMAVSSVEGDANVAGVFVNWDDDDTDFTADMNIAMTGDFVIRIASGTAVARGDLLMSAGDGTAKPQGDDIVRSKTIAKVTSTNVSHTYDDGSYLVPCVLMAC